jgi:hypothetical protein
MIVASRYRGSVCMPRYMVSPVTDSHVTIRHVSASSEMRMRRDPGVPASLHCSRMRMTMVVAAAVAVMMSFSLRSHRQQKRQTPGTN